MVITMTLACVCAQKGGILESLGIYATLLKEPTVIITYWTVQEDCGLEEEEEEEEEGGVLWCKFQLLSNFSFFLSIFGSCDLPASRYAYE